MMIDHFKKVSLSMIFSLGKVMAINDMMICFMDYYSFDNIMIKNNSITEDHKLFVLALRDWVYCFHSRYGRMRVKQIRMSANKIICKEGKFEDMIWFVINVVVTLKYKTKEHKSMYI